MGRRYKPGPKVGKDLFSFAKPTKLSDAVRWQDVYKTQEWAELSREVKFRDGWTCQDCGKVATTPWERRFFHAHHIVELSKTVNNSKSNLKTVCHACHKKYHKHMQRKRK